MIGHSVATLTRTSVTWKVCYYPWCFLIWAPNPNPYKYRDSKNNVNYFITVFFLNVVGKAFWLDDVGFVWWYSIEDEVEINIVGFVLWNSVELGDDNSDVIMKTEKITQVKNSKF